MNRKDMLLKFREIQDRNMKTVRDKNKTYGADGDAFQAFKDAVSYGSKIETQPQALWNMMSKHLVTVKRWVDEGTVPSEEEAAEKLGDIVIYMGLLELMWRNESEGRCLGHLSLHNDFTECDGSCKPKGMETRYRAGSIDAVNYMFDFNAEYPDCGECDHCQDGDICGVTGEVTVYNRVGGSCGPEGRNFKQRTSHICNGCDYLHGTDCSLVQGYDASAELMRSNKNLCGPDKNWYKAAMGKSLK